MIKILLCIIMGLIITIMGVIEYIMDNHYPFDDGFDY
jgi:hypothetical protein